MSSPLQSPVKSAAPVALPQDEPAVTVHPSRLSDYWALSKPRVTILVWITTLLGMVIAAGVADIQVGGWLFFHMLVGSWLVIAAANVFNQVLEREADSKMRRTRTRPIASGRIATREGWALGAVWVILGLSQLALFVNLLVALFGAVSIAAYAFAYTPLKPRSHLATAIGAIPGAIPPLAGWVAVTGSISLPGIMLFALQFFWQFPHFWAIAWLLREDYFAAGFKMLPFPGADGKSTALATLQYSLAAWPLSFAFSVFVLQPVVYVLGAFALNLWITLAAHRFWVSPGDAQAKKVLKASVVYLPLLLLLLVCCL